MPLIHSSSKSALNQNMKTLHDDIGKSPHVKSRAQAIAIALDTQRRARNRAPGGMVMPGSGINSGPAGIFPTQVPTQTQTASGVNSGPTPVTTTQATGISYGGDAGAPQGAPQGNGISYMPPGAMMPQGVMTPPPPMTPPPMTPPPNMPPRMPPTMPGGPGMMGGVNSGGQGFSQQLGQWENNHPEWMQNHPNFGNNFGNFMNPSGGFMSPRSGINGGPAPVTGSISPGGGVQGGPVGITPTIQSPVASRNRADGGPFNMAKAPHMSTPWQTRAEAKSVGVHTGPVLSTVPGRTDHHPTNVPSGSYVIPADVVSGRGQGNTLAGAKALQAMFKMGPYGTSIPHLGHGAGIPRGPRLQKVAASGGGKSGDGNVGTPTPVNIAGGEIVVPPENLMDTVHPDLDTAHRIMDSWVLHERKNHINTLKKLPGPAKD